MCTRVVSSHRFNSRLSIYVLRPSRVTCVEQLFHFGQLLRFGIVFKEQKNGYNVSTNGQVYEHNYISTFFLRGVSNIFVSKTTQIIID